MRALPVTAAALALAACGGDNGSSESGGSECPDVDGATEAQLVEVFGREADHVEDGSHYWYFRDDDQVVIDFLGGEVNGYAWHDGDEFMMAEDTPNCPLPQPDEDHPAKFNIENSAPTGEDCDMPAGEPCPTDDEGNVDRWAEYTRCVAEDIVPNDECPTPGELLDEEQGE